MDVATDGSPGGDSESRLCVAVSSEGRSPKGSTDEEYPADKECD
jgi:hypothetical protein